MRKKCCGEQQHVLAEVVVKLTRVDVVAVTRAYL